MLFAGWMMSLTVRALKFACPRWLAFICSIGLEGRRRFNESRRSFTLWRTHGTFRTLAVSVSALFHFDFDSFSSCYRCRREVHFQHSVAEIRRHLRAVGIFRQREAASKIAKGSLGAMEFSFLIFLLAFAFARNAEDAVFDCYSNVILLHFRQVSFEEIPAIILADINLRRPICDRQAVDLATAHSVRKSGQEERIEAILRFVHLSKRIPCCYFIQCIHLILPFWVELKPSRCIALTAYCQSR